MAKKDKTIEIVILRTYPKIIFFYPLFLFSLTFWILQLIIVSPNTLLGYIWFIVFFVNLFVIGFDFPFNSFILLVLAIVVSVLLLLIFILPTIQPTIIIFNLGSTAEFYGVMAFVLGIILGFELLKARLDYYKIERNEILHKIGIFSNTSERFPVRSLRIKHEITDVLEFMLLGAGSITLYPKEIDPIHLYTVVRVKKKMKQIDWLLSHWYVKTDDQA